MKLITAYIQTFLTSKVTAALRAAKIHGASVVQCEGFGRMADDAKAPHYLEQAAALGFVAKTKLEIVCAEADLEGIIATIREHAHTGHHGDGKIFVSDIADAVDIRTGVRGEGVV